MADKLEFIIGSKDKFSKDFSKLRSALPGIGKMAKTAGLAFAAMGASIFAMVKTTATAYDKVQKLSDRLGVSTQFLSKMAYAADLSGVKVEAMNKAVEMLSVRIQEANKGTGLAVEAFDKLGVALTDSNGQLRTSADIMPDIAEAFGNMTNATERTAAAYQIFGMRGTAMVQMFKDGKDGLEEMTSEAEKFGLVISAEAGANAAEFNDSLTRLIGSMRGLKNTLAEDLMHAFTKSFNNIAEVIANNRQEMIGWAKYGVGALLTFFEGAITGAEMATQAVSGFRFVFASTVQTMSALSYASLMMIGVDEATAVMQELSGMAKAGDMMAQDMYNSMTKTSKAFDGLRGHIRAMFADFQDYGGNSMPGIPEPDKQAEIIDAATERYQKYLEYVRALNSEHGELTIQNAINVAERQKEIEQLKADAITTIAGDLYSAMGSLGKEYFELMKNVQTIDTIISTISSAQKAYESLVWIPGVGPALATAAAAAAIIAGMARVAQIRAQSYPSAHGGLGYVPREQTYLLDEGERVLSPNQNSDLKAFMEGNAGPQVVGSTFQVSFPNTDLSNMSKSEVEDFAEQKIAPALKKLATAGLY